jgi:hypothetical protein
VKDAAAPLVLVTTGGRVGPSARAKGTVLRGVDAMAEEADALQALGPRALEDALLAMTAEEQDAARSAMTKVLRFACGSATSGHGSAGSSRAVTRS